MSEMKLPQCEVCKYYETCVKHKVDKGSLFCMGNFYVGGYIWAYYEENIDEFAMTEEQLMVALEEEE